MRILKDMPCLRPTGPLHFCPGRAHFDLRASTIVTQDEQHAVFVYTCDTCGQIEALDGELLKGYRTDWTLDDFLFHLQGAMQIEYSDAAYDSGAP